MPIAVVRLGSPRGPQEGLRIGTVRRPPRGVPKLQFSKLDYYDVWLPSLSPSPQLVTIALQSKDEKSWKAFERKYRAEMKHPDAARLLDLLAALSHQTNFALLLRRREPLPPLHPQEPAGGAGSQILLKLSAPDRVSRHVAAGSMPN